MRFRSYLLPAVVLAALIGGSGAFASCGKGEPPPEPPGPSGPTQAELDSIRADSIRRAREDSLRMARLREEEEMRRREEAIRNARAVLEQMVFFEFDRSRLTPAAQETLRDKIDMLRGSPAVQLRLEGHADERGSTEYNLALGSRRSQSVLDFLTSFGLDGSRFGTLSYGEERPLVNRSDEEAWAQNRRVEFIITAGADQINPLGVSP